MKIKSAFHLALAVSSSWSACAAAQVATDDNQDDEVVVTGTRAVGIQASESAAPVQVLTPETLSHVGQPSLTQVLTQLVPSFNTQTQGSDLSNFSYSARLRGLSPNHTLVLVNGKRRHGSAILQVSPGAFKGSAAPSIDLIPAASVARVEVLQEGAAAVYGTDAIAGAINFILKDQDEGGTANLTAGQYYNGQGDLYSASGNVGFKLGEAGFFNLTAFHQRQAHTTQGSGQVVITQANGTLQPNAPAQWANLAGGTLARINGGQPESRLSILSYNSEYDLGGVTLYSFGDISRRVGNADQGYRAPGRICYFANNPNGNITTAAYDPSLCYGNSGIYGILPIQHVVQNEYSLTGGIKGEIEGWSYDLSGTYGYEKNDITIRNSANREIWIESYQASLLPGSTVRPNTPSSAYAGGFRLSQTTITADIQKSFDVGMANPLTLAFGGEYRRDGYEIVAGDYYSTYKTGIQSFPGYKQSDAGDYRRTSYAGYVNLIAKPLNGWSIDLAGRVEHYSDFGGTQIGKLTSRYDISTSFAVRGTIGTGFRAPTLAEQKYSTIAVTPTGATAQLPAGSPAAALLGFNNLKPEKSFNASTGIVMRPAPKLLVTIDGYYIKITDRIAGTSPRFAVLGGVVQPGAAAINTALAAAGITLDPGLPNISVSSFTNGIDTRTLGIDVAAHYPVDLSFGSLELSLTGNYGKTKVIKNRIPAIFNDVSESYVEGGTPSYKIILGGLFKTGRFSLNARETFYGKTSILVTPAVSGLASRPGVVKATGLTDLEASYQVTSGITFSMGANNLFNKLPEGPHVLTGVTVPAGTSPFDDGIYAYDFHYRHGPYGTAGGFYYARLAFQF
ncbi:TonB-dependent siderophore receptor [Sphingomonas sp.]|uniref:TonB-dependent receptor plug domain-containing protein n=1 Tax=Sphingomonas sp. TaxID=28214 RepID=UPI000DB0949F|nr:TonB-dependent receptor [Sphingomonas sp.]PZU06423.1 MAG: TonB-dependent receptor [Sphingomonas sp.]